jgi:hypothetical protein
MPTTDDATIRTLECLSSDSGSLERLKQRAIENGKHVLDVNAACGRRLSPRDDVDRAMQEDATSFRELSWPDRDDVRTVLLNYELRQLHRGRWGSAPARGQPSAT